MLRYTTNRSRFFARKSLASQTVGRSSDYRTSRSLRVVQQIIQIPEIQEYLIIGLKAPVNADLQVAATLVVRATSIRAHARALRLKGFERLAKKWS